GVGCLRRTGGFNSCGFDATSQVLVVEDLSRGSDGLRPPGHFSLLRASCPPPLRGRLRRSRRSCGAVLRQRKVTKRKATRMKRPRCARVRVGPPGFSDGTIPVPAENSRASCARPCGPGLRPAAASYGTQEQDQGQKPSQACRRRLTSPAHLARVALAGAVAVAL